MLYKYAKNKRVLATGKFCYPEPVALTGTFVSSKPSIAITSITLVGSVATVTATANHNLKTGDIVTIAGANQAGYNGKKKITVTGVTTFTFYALSTTVTPATGTITAAPSGAWATGTLTQARVQFQVGDWLYVPAQNALRQVIEISSATLWKLSEPFPTNISSGVPVLMAHPEQELMRGLSALNTGAGDGTFMETTFATTDPAINLADEAGISPVCGDATGTTFSLIITS